MSYQIISAFVVGLLLGWATKIPVFLHYYREWERERDLLKRFMNEHKEREDNAKNSGANASA